ncbi:DinB family protein [Poseidonocella sp. HB161398]|uniref:DinB family protein n=1 Tax=Poseidonocella sp. HB161398 TaxID=2320855 RepID=UPI001109CD0A|nr:DinB family protein [Poseidonocella sp. HB161398]
MITPDWMRVMARYNRWQNAGLMAAAGTLTEEARQADRGAWFGSISGTFNHLLWGDLTWLSRFGRNDRPEVALKDSPRLFPDWEGFRAARMAQDAVIAVWAEAATPADLEGDLVWTSVGDGAELRRPRAICIMQIFNHQTHHRGQIHAMLTAAGARPGTTDLPFLPDDA